MKEQVQCQFSYYLVCHKWNSKFCNICYLSSPWYSVSAMLTSSIDVCSMSHHLLSFSAQQMRIFSLFIHMCCFFMAQLSGSVKFFNEEEPLCPPDSWNTMRTFLTAVQLCQFKESLKNVKNIKYKLLPNERKLKFNLKKVALKYILRVSSIVW